MNLREYFDDPSAMTQTEMALQLGLGDVSQLGQWVRCVNGRVPGPYYCIRIEELTRGMVTCEEMHPDAGWCRVQFSGVAWPYHPNGYPMIDPWTAAKK